MIVEEYKIDATLIKIHDDNIATKEENEEIINILLSLILKKFENIDKRR